MVNEQILTNACVVTRDDRFSGTVVLRGGRIAEVDDSRSHLSAAEDCGGDLLLPGLVEIHTDNLERHFVPRPGVLWPSSLGAVLAHDSQIVAAGITTVLDAICVGEYREGGKRRHILSESIATVRAARAEGLLRADHLLHLRCEIADAAVLEMFEPYADDDLLRLVSVMDHTPGQRQWVDLAKYRAFYRGEGWSEADMDSFVAEQIHIQARFGARHRFALVERCRARGVPLASHDDATEEHVAEAAADGIAVAEFPTTRAAAEAARRHGIAIIMGAPNLVRGQSHSGNVSAGELAEAGLLDALSSDYVPASLLHGAMLLHQRHGWTLPAAVATVSSTPADLLGLADRGRIEPGRRGDLVRVALHRDHPLVRMTWCCGRRVA